MHSHNHYFLGSVWERLFRDVAGIEPDSRNPGFRPFILGRYTAASLTHARDANRTLHAEILRPWKLTGDQLVWTIGVPADCPAGVVVPHAPGTPRFAAGLTPRVQDGPPGFEAFAGTYTPRSTFHL